MTGRASPATLAERGPDELVAEFFASTVTLRQNQIDYLTSRAVPLLALARDPHEWGFLVGATHVVMGRGDFDFAEEAHEDASRALIIVGRDRFGEPRDLIAWEPRSDRVAAYYGNLALLGAQRINAPRLDDGPLAVHQSVLGWLRGDRRGVVILDERRAWRVLEGVEVAAEDVEHGKYLRKILRPPAPRILVQTREAT